MIEVLYVCYMVLVKNSNPIEYMIQYQRKSWLPNVVLLEIEKRDLKEAQTFFEVEEITTPII